MQTPKLHTARIKDIKKLNNTVYLFTFTLLDDANFQFVAGQYGSVIIDSTIRRQYSFCSDPREMGTFQMVIDTKPMGPGSTYFLSKKIGDAIQLLAPLGMFSMMSNSRKKIMIATGTGLAPLRSMILAHATKDSIQLLWGLRHEEDIYWNEEFEALAKQYSSFTYTLSLSQPSDAWKGIKGHVTDQITQIEQMDAHDYYICGNQHMIADVQTALLAHHVPEGQIKTERF